MKKRIVTMLLAICLAVSCLAISVQASKSEDIVILYENDVHCAVDGYAKLAAMKAELAEHNAYVGVASVGDYIQGSSLGAISQGGYIVELMNLVGYDAVTLGNHEFDYRLSRLNELVALMNTKPVCSNFKKSGESNTVFDPYTIVTYGETAVAYVGITTPSTLTSSSPTQFMDENGAYVYSFHGTDLYDVVQNSIDAAKAAGADYVVALSHLGTEDVKEEWSAQALVQNTDGLDVVLDGHSHSVIESMTVTDKGGDAVTITSTGTKFAHIGKLTIATDGTITTKLIETDGYEATDKAIAARIEAINAEYAALGDRKIGESKVDLITADADGNRLVRKEQTNLGDFCADAYRVVTGADIGVQNGGGIRADMAAGEVTFNDILSVFPFNNTICVAEVTGQQIVDLLELGVMFYPEENGSFQHVSGLTFTLDDTVASTVKLDENEVFVSVEGARRVKDVKVLNKDSGAYEPIDLDSTYTLASHNYLLLDGGGGASMLDGINIIQNDGLLDVEMLEIYITEYLGGVIGEEYAASQGRITVGVPADPTPDTPDEDDTNAPQTGASDTVSLLTVVLLMSGMGLLTVRQRAA